MQNENIARIVAEHPDRQERHEARRLEHGDHALDGLGGEALATLALGLQPRHGPVLVMLGEAMAPRAHQPL